MHKPHDFRAKGIFARALRTRGDPGTEVEIPPGASQRADIVFTPDPARRAARDALGLLGRMTDVPCIIEAFHDPPDTAEVIACVRKHLNWAHALAGAPPAASPPPSMPSPAREDATPVTTNVTTVTTRLWVVSAGRPGTALRELGCRPVPRRARGVYEAPVALRLGIVVVPELPPVRDTLLVRLAGRDATLARALADLAALPADAPERAHAMPTLLSLQLVPHDARVRMTEDEQVNEQLRILFDQYTQQIMLEGEQRGRVEGEQRGRVEGEQRGRLEGERRGEQRGRLEGRQHGRLDELARLCARRLRRPLSEAESAQLAARLAEHGPEPIEDLLLDGTPDALAAWLRHREPTPSSGTPIP